MNKFNNFVNKFKQTIISDKKILVYPYTVLINNFCKILVSIGYINYVTTYNFNNKIFLIISLTNNKKNYLKKPYIKQIETFSNKKQQLFLKVKDFKKIPKYVNIVVLSTPLGIMSLNKARILNTGGKVLCYIF